MFAARRFVVVVLAMVVFGIGTRSAHATTDCAFASEGNRMVLQADCTTDATILIPDGITLDGRNHAITAVDPPASNGFKGAIVRNEGGRASVHRLRVDVNGLGTFCDPGEDKLRGISLVGASGFVVDNEILNINQSGGDGCQEGTGIEAVNTGDAAASVRIERNVVRAYQKLGINVSGNVRAVVRLNDVEGFGPVGFIAQIGVLIGGGADAEVEENRVTGNSYTGTQAVQGVGLLVVGGPTVFTTGVRVQRNLVTENDDGIFLDNVAMPGSIPPATPTRNEVTQNFVFKARLTNGGGFQVGIIDVGNRDRITDNIIAGPGYNLDANPGAQVAAILAEAPFAVDPVVRRNLILRR